MAGNPEADANYAERMADDLLARMTGRATPTLGADPQAASAAPVIEPVRDPVIEERNRLFDSDVGDVGREANRYKFPPLSFPAAAAVASYSNTAGAKEERIAYDAGMNTPTREEIDAKLAASEARVDARLAAIEGRFGRVDAVLQSISEQIRTIAADTKTLRQTIITTAIATGVAVILGVGAFNATVLSNMVASFESGKSTAQLNNDAANRVEKAIRELEERAKTPPPPPAAAPAKK